MPLNRKKLITDSLDMTKGIDFDDIKTDDVRSLKKVVLTLEDEIILAGKLTKSLERSVAPLGSDYVNALYEITVLEARLKIAEVVLADVTGK